MYDVMMSLVSMVMVSDDRREMMWYEWCVGV
jgi:hypothetical protein